MAESVYRALLIGNSTFPLDSGNLPSLEGPVKDITLLHDALTHPASGMFDPQEVRLVAERTMSEVLVELDQFFGTASRNDRLMLYYSGHGLLTSTGELRLATRDTRTDRLLATTVGASAINSMIEGSPALTTIIVLDCCYSGSFKGGALPRSLEGSGRYLLTSTRSGQLANDADRRNGTSQFTTHLIDGLVSGAPDHDDDGFVDLDDLYGYVHRRLSDIGRQIPQRAFSGGGDVQVARRSPATVGPPAAHSGGVPVRSEADAGHAGSPPLLDVSDTLLDLGEVEPGEPLPVERVAVVNRGSGRLDWVAETDADWLSVIRDGDDVRLELDPRPGTNRATVLVRDRGPGGARTIRVQVRVRPAPAPPPPGRGSGQHEQAHPWWHPQTARAVAIGLVALALVAALFGYLQRGGDDSGGGGGGSMTASPRSVGVPVDGREDWTDTGIDVAAGASVTVTAGGEVFHNETSSIGPEGIPNRLELQTPFPQWNHAALIARVGDDRNSVELVGTGASFTAQVDGRLFLGVNDGGLENNRGYWAATVTVEPSSPSG